MQYVTWFFKDIGRNDDSPQPNVDRSPRKRRKNQHNSNHASSSSSSTHPRRRHTVVPCSANEHSLEGDFQMVTNDLLKCNGADEEEEGMETDERWTCKR